MRVRQRRRGGGSVLIAATFLGIVSILRPAAARAQDEPAAPRIRDNLFLLEEAYNQEPGVVQHIQVFQIGTSSGAWSYGFTQEWPAPDDRHQVSVTIPVAGVVGTGIHALGDVQLNYRVQALGMGGKGIAAIAPRLSVVLPSGSAAREAGRGAWGLQVNLPVSVEAGRWFVVHLNAGGTASFQADAPDGSRSATVFDANAGAALVWQPRWWFNVLVEVAYLNVADLDRTGTHRRSDLVVNPGVRFAIDDPASGLQVVPGLSVPVRVWPRGDIEVGILGYLSLEHPAF